MKTILSVLLLVVFSSTAQAALNMKPGLWAVKSTISQDGKEIDPQAEMKKALEKMPADQRKKVEAMMKNAGANMGENDVKVCYTQMMIENENALMQQGKDQCETKFTHKSSSKLAGTFSCKDGSAGEMEWNLSDNTHYKGKVKLTKGGKDTHVSYTGSFVNTDCGDVKPLDVSNLVSPAKKKK